MAVPQVCDILHPPCSSHLYVSLHIWALLILVGSTLLEMKKGNLAVQMSTSTIDWSQYVDIAGQLPSLQGYTQFILFFKSQNDSKEKKTLVQSLSDTSTRLASLFPWISGMVVNEGRSNDDSGTFKIIPGLSHADRFDIVENEELHIGYSELSLAHFPMSVLYGDKFSPKFDLTSPYDLSKQHQPVMVIQTTFLKGGLAITFAAAHNCMDMSGLGKFIELFAKVIKGEDVTREEHMQGDRDRRGVIPPMESSDIRNKSQILKWKTEEAGNDTATPAADVATPGRWAYVRFSSEKLGLLRTLASQANRKEESDDIKLSDEHPVWISTDDSLTAFIWQRITHARQVNNSSTTSKLCRAINTRRLLAPSVSESYMGQMVACTFNTISTMDMFRLKHLPDIARDLRTKLNQLDDQAIRNFFWFIQRQKDKSQISFTAHMDLSKDLLISSGAGLPLHHLDFGPLLGMCESVRRPWWNVSNGVVYFMPKNRDGAIDAAICLSEKDWIVLQQDENWTQFADYIG
jgi:hypothetical protein